MSVLVVVNAAFNIPTEIKVKALTGIADFTHPDPLHQVLNVHKTLAFHAGAVVNR